MAVPTTAGTGSETTLAAVITDAQTRHKYAINDFPLIPRYAVLDPKVTLSLPPFITATTGMDALTHAVEALSLIHIYVNFSPVISVPLIYQLVFFNSKCKFCPFDSTLSFEPFSKHQFDTLEPTFDTLKVILLNMGF